MVTGTLASQLWSQYCSLLVAPSKQSEELGISLAVRMDTLCARFQSLRLFEGNTQTFCSHGGGSLLNHCIPTKRGKTLHKQVNHTSCLRPTSCTLCCPDPILLRMNTLHYLSWSSLHNLRPHRTVLGLSSCCPENRRSVSTGEKQSCDCPSPTWLWNRKSVLARKPES